MLKLGRKRISLIISACLVLGAGLFATFAYKALRIKIATANGQLKIVEIQIKDARGRINLVDQWDKESIEQELSKLKNRLPTQQNTHIILDELTKLGERYGINFISISPQSIEKRGEDEVSYRKLPIQMGIRCKYVDLGEYLGAIDNLENSLVAVKDFDITTDEGILPELSVQLTLETYILSEESAGSEE